MKSSNLPLRVLQFGEGNFLRAFIDWMIDMMNEKIGFDAGIAVVQPIESGLVKLLKNQKGQYHHIIQGLNEHESVDDIRTIYAIQKMINPFDEPEAYFSLAENHELKLVFSNTTEAGIQFNENDIPKNGTLAVTFPGKLTQLLKKRFDHFKGSPESGLCIIPCELIENNGSKLKTCINQYIELWQLGDDFKQWIHEHTHFANTLVDRIVPGYPRDEMDKILPRLQFNDKLVVKSEVFHLFVIQGDKEIARAFPADKAGLNVRFVKDITPFRKQKVRILNGAHTAMVPLGLLMGTETVMETINHDHLGKFIEKMIFEEIVPTIDIPGEDPAHFAGEVLNRFKNPFIRHELTSIALNSISKFRVRVLPTILDYLMVKGELPECLILAFAALLKLYLSHPEGLNDNQEFIEFFGNFEEPNEEMIRKILGNTSMWGQDLNEIEGLRQLVWHKYRELDNIIAPVKQLMA